MKKLPLIVLIILFSICSFGQFHIKIVCFGKPNEITDWKQYYAIIFTNDNWRHSASIMDQFDIGSLHSYQEKLINDKDDAIIFARTLNSFDRCVKYNQNVLIASNKAQIIADKRKAIEDEQERKDKLAHEKKIQCCKEIKIY